MISRNLHQAHLLEVGMPRIPVDHAPLSMADIKFPHTNYGACQIRAGAASSEIFEPDRKLLPAPSNLKKNIALAFLKAT